MKFLPLVWTGIWRKKTRAVLMLLQITSAFTLFGILQGLNTGIKDAIAKTHGDRLYVLSSVSRGDSLPLGLLSRIEGIPGVKAVGYSTGWFGTYQKPTEGVTAIVTDPERFARIYPDYSIPRNHLAALVNTRTGAIVGEVVAKKYAWKIGDRIGFQSPIPQQNGSRDWAFDVVGIYSTPEQPEQANQLIVNYAYVNEARATARDTVSDYVVLVKDPGAATTVGLNIDNAFANSSNETRTQSESELAQSQLQRIGDLDYIVHNIVGAVFFALLLATGALMMQSIRERVPELAVLKTVGFSDRRVLVLILAESIALCLFAATLGLCLAALILPAARNFVGVARLPGIVVIAGLGFAALLAAISGAVPAWRGSRLQVANALAER